MSDPTLAYEDYIEHYKNVLGVVEGHSRRGLTYWSDSAARRWAVIGCFLAWFGGVQVALPGTLAFEKQVYWLSDRERRGR